MNRDELGLFPVLEIKDSADFEFLKYVNQSII